MEFKVFSQDEPFQQGTGSLSKDNSGVGISSNRRIDELFPIGSEEADIHFAFGPCLTTYRAISIDASLIEEFFANDSLGG